MPSTESETARATARTMLRWTFMAGLLNLYSRRLRRRQHRFRDRVRQRLRGFEQSKQRQDDEQEHEVISREDARRDHVATFGRPRTEIAEADHHQEEDDQELPIERPVLCGAHTRGIEPRQ